MLTLFEFNLQQFEFEEVAVIIAVALVDAHGLRNEAIVFAQALAAEFKERV